MTPLTLASASEIRATLLRDAGVAFNIVTAIVDEDALKQGLLVENATPRDIADQLAEMKARRVAQKGMPGLVLGADQVLVLEGRILSKPADLSAAREQLISLRGRAHELLSAAVIFEGGKPVWRHIGRAQLVVRNFSDSFLDDYILRYGDDLLATVGSYKLEAGGASLFTRVQGDYFSILGLPLLEVLGFLRTRGVIKE